MAKEFNVSNIRVGAYNMQAVDTDFSAFVLNLIDPTSDDGTITEADLELAKRNFQVLNTDSDTENLKAAELYYKLSRVAAQFDKHYNYLANAYADSINGDQSKNLHTLANDAKRKLTKMFDKVSFDVITIEEITKKGDEAQRLYKNAISDLELQRQENKLRVDYTFARAQAKIALTQAKIAKTFMD